MCANGKRDACCAIVGRPVAAAAAEAHPGRVWETTHLGGHRFAPTAVALPSGWTFGRLTAESAGRRSTRSGPASSTSRGRGRSVWPGPGQVAELAVRRHLDARGVDDVTAVVRADDGWTVTPRRRTPLAGRGRASATGEARPESCGKKPARRRALRRRFGRARRLSRVWTHVGWRVTAPAASVAVVAADDSGDLHQQVAEVALDAGSGAAVSPLPEDLRFVLAQRCGPEMVDAEPVAARRQPQEEPGQGLEAAPPVVRLQVVVPPAEGPRLPGLVWPGGGSPSGGLT